MTDSLDVINKWKHRALTAEKKLKEIAKFCFKNRCFAIQAKDIFKIIQGVENGINN